MEPITAGLQILGKLLDFGLAVYADTPQAIRAQNAADWGSIFHGISAQILALQAKINGAVGLTK